MCSVVYLRAYSASASKAEYVLWSTYGGYCASASKDEYVLWSTYGGYSVSISECVLWSTYGGTAPASVKLNVCLDLLTGIERQR
jgi:hypothetical protein